VQQGLCYSRRSIQRWRRQRGFRPLKPKTGGEIKEVNKVKRLKYCQEEVENDFDWIIFSDESYFWLNADSRYLWLRKDDPIPLDCAKDRAKKIMVWGGIAKNGYKTKLEVCEGMMNCKKYKKMIKTYKREWKRRFGIYLRFQQDGAPAHTMKGNREWFQTWLPNDLVSHPPYSPDLNPIESIWAIMKKRVQEKEPRNLKELKKVLREVWEGLSEEEVNKTIEHNRKVMREVIAVNGNRIYNV